MFRLVSEREVLRRVAEGHTDKEIGAALRTSRRTVTTQVSGVMAKLGVRSRAHAVAVAIRRGLI